MTVEAPETSNPGFQNLLYVDTTYKDAVTRTVTGQDTVYVGIDREVQPVVVVPAERVEVVKIFFITSKVSRTLMTKSASNKYVCAFVTSQV